MKKTLPLALLLPLLLFARCQSIFPGMGISEGIIEYEITYLDYAEGDVLTLFMPDLMLYKFKDDKTYSNIETVFGLFKFNYISDSKARTHATLAAVSGEKYFYKASFDEPILNADSFSGMVFEETGNSKEILGFECQEARVSFPDSIGVEPFLVYYTNEIDIEQPNAANPYHSIEGVLLEFQLKVNNMNMRLTAKKVTEAQVPDDIFEIPSQYKQVSRTEMERIIAEN